MACPRCGSATRPGQKFCAECGLALATACPSCGTPYEGNPKFCAECGFAIHAGAAGAADAQPAATESGRTPARAAGTSERRFVTVLFADLVGFTTLSEQRDAEEVRDLLSRYYETARELIDGYGGTVEKFIGDAVMAVWGAPVAREDDPERAVRAALELVERVRGLALDGEPLGLRAGVLSGEAAVTLGASGQGLVAGDLVNTASRLQSVAPAGVVLVGEVTQRATSAAIAYEPAGEQLLKGKAAPVAAWRALRVVARVGGEGREVGLEPPFVGRDDELRLLKDELHAAERENRLRVVSITGQAGMGKSRLAWELEKYLDGLAGPMLYYWHQGRSPAYGEGVTYWALGEMVRRRARIAEGEDEASTLDKLRATLAEFVPDPDERRWLEPALGALLGVADADWDAREKLFSAWRLLFERISDKGPTVLVFEDLQWADSGLLDFIDHLLEWSRERPILIVTLARPELLERRPNFGLGHRSFVALHLEPLADAAMAELLHGLVPGLPEADRQRIIARAEGVPLYAVETIRALVDGGHLVRRNDAYELAAELPPLETPPTLRALIASRLDALEPADRSLVQDAAVIGQVFGVTVLAALSGRSEDDIAARLRVLSSRELVALETDPRSPERGQYRFTQGLIREVAYGTLARRERRARHLAAARYYDTLGEDEIAAVLANHYVEAYQAVPEGEEGAAVAAQARVALRSAADRAARLHSNEQALAYLEKALAVTFDEPERIQLRVQAADAATALGRLDTAEEHLRDAAEWYRAQGDPQGLARTLSRLGRMMLYASRVSEASELLTSAIAELPADTGEELLPIHGELARVHLFSDRPEQALEAVSRALEGAEQTGRETLTLHLLLTKSWALAAVRRLREGTALLLGVMQIADEAGDLSAQTRARFNLSSYLAAQDPHQGLRVALEGIELSRQYGLTMTAANMAGNAANNALLVGDLDKVFEIEQGVTRLRAPIAASVYGYAAIASALRGDKAESARRMAVIEEEGARSTSAQDLSGLRYMQAAVAFAEGRFDDALRLARESYRSYFGSDSLFAAVLAQQVCALRGDLDGLRHEFGTAATSGHPGLWVERHVRQAEAALAALEGRADDARVGYRRVIDEWRGGDLRLDLALALLERGRLLDAADAAADRAEAQRILTEMGAGGLIERLESGAGPAPAGARPGLPARPQPQERQPA